MTKKNKEDIDVLVLLVKMYGNDKNIFVQDYQFVLADALLASCSDDKQEDEHFTIGELSCAYEQVVPHTVNPES